MTGRRVGFRVDVDPDGGAIMTPVEETAPAAEPARRTAKDTELQAALAAARDRGRLRAAEILAGEDMLSADAFAECSATRVTVDTGAKGGQVGLAGSKRGFRFPAAARCRGQALCPSGGCINGWAGLGGLSFPRATAWRTRWADRSRRSRAREGKGSSRGRRECWEKFPLNEEGNGVS